MFLRTVKARGRKDEMHEYLRMVETYREKGRTLQRVVMNLGRKDLLAPHLDSLVRILSDPADTDKWVRSSGVQPDEASCWGGVMVARHLWEELGLDVIISNLAGKRKRDGADVAERAFVLVANRLCSPGSEHRLAQWLETDYVCDSGGKRWLVPWESHGRVQVNLSWLQRWYRTLDKLVELQEGIEQALYLRLRDLFSLNVELVFYDLTSTYFEGKGSPELGRHGYSRDGKPRNKQVQVGVVMVNGWLVAHHVFAGNLRESKTLPVIISDLEERFGLKRVVLVSDRGMVTSDNLEMLRNQGHGYLVGLQRRRREESYELINKASGEWQKCPSDRDNGCLTLVQEVAGDRPGVRVFVVQSEERLSYEREMREQSMERTRRELENLRLSVEAGRIKAAEKIGARASQILSRNHGHRYYDWELRDGKFHYYEHPNLEREKAYEGKYLIQTEEQELTPVEAVTAYKELSEVENAFRCLKDVIEMRPIYHREDVRVKGHILVAFLAFILNRALDKKLKAAGSQLSGKSALKALSTIHVVRLQVGDQYHQGVTGGSQRAREVLKALGISTTNPPGIS